MGLISGALGSALGGSDVKNGFNGPRLPFRSQRSSQQQYSTDDQRSSYLNPRSGQFANRNQSTSPNPPSRYLSPNNYSTQRYDERSYSSDNLDGSQECQDQGPPSYNYDRNMYNSDNGYNRQSDRGYGYKDSYTNGQYRGYSSQSGFRVVALPQTSAGDGQPFLRGYSSTLQQYGISRSTFIQTIDRINVAIVPNPEMQLFQQGANIAGWFLPGAASTGLMVGQIVVGVGGAFGHSAAVNKVLADSNLKTFLPEGLEICIGSSQDVDSAIGSRPYSSQPQPNAGPMEKLGAYGNLLASLDEILPEATTGGRRDPIAMLGKGLASRNNQKKQAKDAKKAARGKSSGGDKTQWLIVRSASDKAIAEWQKVLQQSSQDLKKAEQGAQTPQGR